MKFSASVTAAVLSLCLVSAWSQASVYTMNISWGGYNTVSWSDPAQWGGSGYPVAGDTANMNASYVKINLGANAVGAVNLQGSYLTLQNGTLTVGTAFNFTGGNSVEIDGALAGAGSLNVSGGQLQLTNGTNSFGGGVHVTGGMLIAGPREWGTNWGSYQYSDCLGAAGQTIYLGATGGAAADATIMLGGNGTDSWTNNVYSQPIVVQAGNSGMATIETFNNFTDSTQITGGITLNKDVTLLNNWQRTEYWMDNRGALYVSSAITGTGNVIKDGIGNLWLSGNNTFTGNLIIDSGEVYISGGSNAFTGSYQVQNGYLCFASAASLGADNILLGSANGTGYMAIAGTGNAVTITNAISLTGLGGVVDDRECGLTLNGTITGGGALSFRGFNWTDVIGGSGNNYSGGTNVINSSVGVASGSSIGTGPVLVARHGWLNFAGAGYSSNVFTLQGATAGDPLVQVPILTIPVNAATVPVISSNSSNFVLLFDNDSRNNVWNAQTSAAINTMVASPIGDGTGFLGAGAPYDNGNDGWPLMFTPDSLAIGAGNTYRFATRAEFQINRDGVNNGNTTGLLVDVGGVPANVQVGTSSIDYQGYTQGGVDLLDNNSYTGLTTVVANAWLHACPSTSATNPLGDPGGNVVLNAGNLSVDGRWQPRVNGNLNPVVVQKNNLSVEAHPLLAVNSNWNDSPAFIQFASITRVNNSVLRVSGGGQGWDPDKYLGDNERIGIHTLQDVGGLAGINGVAIPWLIETMDSIHTADFLDYGGDVTGTTPGTGLVRATYTVNGTAGGVNSQTDFNNTIPGDIVNVLSNISVSGAKTVYALKVGSAQQTFNRTTGNWETTYTDNLNISGSGTICVTSGAMIVTGPGPWGDSNSYNPGWGGTPSGNINVISPNITTGNGGANELVIYTPHQSWEQATRIDGQIITTGGLTKSGNGTLILNADNSSTLQGTITLDSGTIQIHNANNLGSGTIIMNNWGTAGWQYGLSTLGLTAPMTINNPIYLGNNGGQVCSDNSQTVTYAGKITGPGSLTNWGNQIVITNKTSDYSGGTLVRGDIYLPPSISTPQGYPTGPLGTGPVYVGQPLEIGDPYALQNNPIIFDYHAGPGRIYMWSSAVLGSIEGGDINTCIFMYNNNETLTVGGNNRSTDFYGQIQTNNGGCGLTKVGSGTLTLWGPSTYSGTTNVNAGTLAVNGRIVGAVQVNDNGTLAGAGTVDTGVQVNDGGTLAGSLHITGGVTVYGGTANMSGATVDGGLTVDTDHPWSGDGNPGLYSGTSVVNGYSEVDGGTITGTHTFNGQLALDGLDAPAVLSGTNTVNGELDIGYNGHAASVSGATTVNNVGGNLNISSGSMSGTGTVNAAWLVLSNSGCSFSGTFNVNANVMMYGGTFQGNHTIRGSFTTAANSNAVVAPHNGTAAGTLTVVGNVTLDYTTTLDFNLGQSGTIGSGINDLIDVTGNLSLDGTLNVTALTDFNTGTYRLFNYTGTLTMPSGGLAQGTMPSGLGYTYTIDTTTTGQVNLDVVMPYAPGDTNHDGAPLNSLDIDAIYHNFGAPAGSQWKVDGSGTPVDQADVTFELRTYFHTNYGDANLDTKTDFLDFQVLLDHWQANGPNIGWQQGDFNGDYTVDFLDFQKLLDYWNPGGWSFAPAQTPEPATLTLLALGGLALLRRRK